MIARGLKRWNLTFGLGLPPSSGVREALQWMMLARLGILYVVLTMIVLQQVFRRESLGSPQLILGYGLLATSFSFNLLFATVIEKLPQRWWIAAVHILFDALITSCWIFQSGGRDSLFALLYLIQILIVSLILYQKGAWFTAISACISFAIVLSLRPQPNALATWGIYSGMFLTLGIIGGYLSEELFRTNESLKEKSRSMEKLMALHERILADIPTGLLSIDNGLRINFINPAGEHILGRAAVDIVGRSLLEVEPGLLPFFSQIDSEAVEADELEGETALSATGSESHRSFFVHGRSDHGSTRLQQRVEIGRGIHQRILRGDVALLDADAGVSGLLDERAKGGRVLIFQDVTKLVHLEEKLKQNEKLAAVGQLAAGIAHEIRNPLASMSASIEMLKGSLVADNLYQENQKLMDIAIREIDRLNRLVTEFLDFVKPEKLRFESVDLPALLGELVLAARGSKDFKEKVRLNELYQPAIALASSEKLKQVIWNLLVNAGQAMKKNGVVEVGCASVNNQRVKFWVEDQGQGMSEEVMSHLYEPFFTTKDKGTGLGLATAYKIIEAHHGEIRVTSTVGVGTRFEILLQSA